MTVRRALWWSLAAHAVLGLAAVRHHFFWGAGRAVMGIDLPVLLNAGEGAALLLFTLVAGIAYLTVVRAAGSVSTRSLLTGGLVLTALAWAALPMLSTDVFDNLARGRVEAIAGLNPYTVAPDDAPGAAPAGWPAEWTGLVMLYGPVSALVQTACAWPDSPWLGVYLLKLAGALSHAGTAWLLWLALRDRPAAADRALALWLWNPWLLLESVTNAHNDAWMALALAAMCLGLRRGRVALATLAFGGAVLTKHGCGVLGPLLLAHAWRSRRLPGFAAGVGLSALVAVPLAWHYFREPGALAFVLEPVANRGTSLQHFATTLFGDEHSSWLLRAGYAVALATLAWWTIRARDLRSFGRGGIGVSVVFLLVAMPLFSPWYHLWWLPLLAAAGVGAVEPALRLLAFAGPASYLVFVSTRSFGPEHQVWQWLLTMALPLATLLVAARRSDRDADQSFAG